MTEQKMTKVTGVIDFHGVQLLVVTHDGVEYVYAKPLSDFAGMAWRTTKRTIIQDHNAILYGTIILPHPSFVVPEGGTSPTLACENTPDSVSEGGDITTLACKNTHDSAPEGGPRATLACKNTPDSAPEGGTSVTPGDQNEGPYLRLDRSRMFLARVNTSRMASHGNVEEAERLLKLQIEWAEAIHAYETTGVAVKNHRIDNRQREEKNLAVLFKTRKDTVNPQEKAALTAMIHAKLAELGFPPEGIKEEKEAGLFN